MNITSTTTAPLGRIGYLILAGYCLLLFGYSLFGGRPLTMHEARLPQTTREMTASSNWQDWVVPKNGGRPWVERPPLPHWITAAITAPFGGVDTVWKARLPATLAGLFCTLLLAWMTARLFGRATGLLAGFLQATMYEFFAYSWLAEDDIFLCAVIYSALAVFVHLEFSTRYGPAPEGTPDSLDGPQPGHFLRSKSELPTRDSLNPLKWRPWPVLGLFILLGATNLAKGLVFGTVMATIPLAGYLLWNLNFRRILRYIWVWGWLVFAAVAVWWPLLTEHLVPGSAAVWRYDLFERLQNGFLGEKWYYYLQQMPGIVAPWTPLCLLGMILTFLPALRTRYSPLRFIWCWGVLTVIVFSLSDSKHHHYMLHITGAWAVFAAFGMRWLWEKLPDLPPFLRHPALWIAVTAGGLAPLWVMRTRLEAPLPWLVTLSIFLICAAFALSCGLRYRKPLLALGALLLALTGLTSFIHTNISPRTDQTLDDTRFLQETALAAPADLPLVINARAGDSMDFFRIQFYLPARAQLLHNATFLRQEKFRGQTIYLIDRTKGADRLREFGKVTLVLQSKHSRREAETGTMALFRLEIRPDLQVFPPVAISPMQAISRADGPLLGGYGVDADK